MANNINVLLIQDDPNSVRLILDMLARIKNAPFHAENTHSLLEGFKYLDQKHIHIVLLDRRLDGRHADTLKQIQLHYPLTATVILIENEAETAELIDAQDYVIKSEMSPRLLEVTLRYALERQRTQKIRRTSEDDLKLVARPKLEQNNTIKEEFLGLIAHEMRTPLASIVGFASMMTSKTMIWPREDLVAYAKIIEEEAQRMSHLIEQLMDHARQQTGTLAVDFETTSFEAIIRSAMPQLDVLTAQHHLFMHIPTGLPSIEADPQRIIQVLANLVGNAARYSQPQTQIMLHVQSQGSCLQVDVIDEGRGIPLDQREKVFEPFHQVDRASTKGIGLGLALCKDLIERHQGQIWIQNHEDRGTIISFTLPIAQMDIGIQPSLKTL